MAICKNCGKETTNKNFCSSECYQEYRQRNQKYCKECGNPLPRNDIVFCCKECKEKYRQKEKEKKLQNANRCIICGKPTFNKKYCSQKCMAKDEERKNTAKNNLKSINENPWTEEELDFIRKNYGIIKLDEIAKHLNRKKENIIATASRHNIQSAKYWTEDEESYLKNNKDKSPQELSQTLNKSISAIINKFSRMNGFINSKGLQVYSPQEFIYNYIKSLNLKAIVKQEVRYGRFLSDILIANKTKRLDIEVNGKNWHVDKRFVDIENLSEEQQKRLDKDKRKYKYLQEEENVDVLIIWEYDIYSNPDKCKELINKKLKELGFEFLNRQTQEKEPQEIFKKILEKISIKCLDLNENPEILLDYYILGQNFINIEIWRDVYAKFNNENMPKEAKKRLSKIKKIEHKDVYYIQIDDFDLLFEQEKTEKFILEKLLELKIIRELPN